MANLNFLNPAALHGAATQRLNANGEAAALDSIGKAHRNGPLVGDPLALAKRAKARPDEDDDEDTPSRLPSDMRVDSRIRASPRTT